MAEMSAALGAVDFGPRHAVLAILGGGDRVGTQRDEKARPPGAALEFRVGLEEGLPAAGAREGARPFFPVERAGARRLGAVLAEHAILIGRQRLAPVVFAFLYGHAGTVAFTRDERPAAVNARCLRAHAAGGHSHAERRARGSGRKSR